MPVVIKKRSGRKLIILIPLLLTFGILAYYQLLYKSPRVDNGVAALAIIFDKHRHNVTAVRFLPGDSLVVTGSVDSTIKIWKRDSGQLVNEIKQNSGIACLDLSADGKYAVTGSYDSVVRLWDLKKGVLVKELRGHNGTVWNVAVSPDGKKIASGGNDAIVNIWDIETGNLLHRLTGHKRIVWAVKFSPDGAELASSSFDFTFKLWNVADGRLLWDNREHKNVQAVTFSPDDKRLMTGGRDKPMIGEFLQTIFGDSKFNPGVSARLWDVETGSLIQTFTKHGNDVMDVAYSHDGRWVATASADKTAEIWKLNE